MNSRMLLLLQLADSAFPVGGFAYSSGMESAVKHGLVNNEVNIKKYLITFSQQIFSFDFPFIFSAYNLNLINLDRPLILTMVESYEAMLLNPPIQKAGEVLGKNWLKVVNQIYKSTILDDFERMSFQLKISLHFPIIFGITMKILQFSIVETCKLFLYLAVRDQVSSLIRLGVAGPTRAQKELYAILKELDEELSDFDHVDYDKAFKTAYLLESAQLNHSRIYSRLFQN